MRNKSNVQRLLTEIETIQQSFIQFIRNTPLTDREREILENQMKHSNDKFTQIRTYLNQEEEDWRFR